MIAGMAAFRHAPELGKGKGLAIGVIAVVGALVLVFALAEHGSFRRFGSGGGNFVGAALPDVTVGDDGEHMPVVTSVRSNGKAERAGIQVGDKIDAVDGRPVRDVAMLRSIVGAEQGAHPIALHIRRGDAIWTIAIDRAEPASGETAAMGATHGAENPAD